MSEEPSLLRILAVGAVEVTVLIGSLIAIIYLSELYNFSVVPLFAFFYALKMTEWMERAREKWSERQRRKELING